MRINPYRIILLTTCTMVLLWSLRRDIRLEKDYTGDLRNRVVGARLVEDGASPYFYKWKKGDSIRYYDPQNFDSLAVSNITGTPFFHHLLRPLADLSQRQISLIWLALEYVLFIVLVTLAFRLAATEKAKMIVLVFSCLFLLTDGWKALIFAGQIYLWLPFLAMLFFMLSRPPGSWRHGVAAGVLVAGIILLRPNAILFFLPFLLWVYRGIYARSFLLAALAPVLLSAAWILGSSHEYALWKDYGKAMGEQVKVHQGLHPVIQRNEPDPDIRWWEGIDRQQAREWEKNDPTKIYSENGNVFVIVRQLFHRNLSVEFLGIAAVAIILLLTGLFYWRWHDTAGAADVAKTILLGYCLYMISDLFSPVFRHQYYTVQWIFPILLAAILYRPSWKGAYWVLLAGLLLNIVPPGMIGIRMAHTLGEYMILTALLYLSFTPAGVEKWDNLRKLNTGKTSGIR